MKKLLFLLAILPCIFSITSCNDNSSKTENAVDTTKKDSTVQALVICAPGDSTQIDYWHIDTATANAMVRNNGRTGKPSGIKYGRDNIIAKLKATYGKGYIGLITARYREEDVERYRTRRCIAATDSAGMVAQFSTYIVKTMVHTKDANGNDPISYEYYDLVTICPPPYDGACNTTKSTQ